MDAIGFFRALFAFDLALAGFAFGVARRERDADFFAGRRAAGRREEDLDFDFAAGRGRRRLPDDLRDFLERGEVAMAKRDLKIPEKIE